MYDSTQFKEKLFKLHTRRFGTVNEIIMEKELGVKKSKNIYYDLQDGNSAIEIKSSRVTKKHKEKINEKNLIDIVYSDKLEYIAFDDYNEFVFDSNIQQIKPLEFNILYYSLYFSDKIIIFKILPEQILRDKNINYCPIQHKNSKDEGQFHINNENFKYHYEKYHYKNLSYNDIYDKFSS